MTQANSTNSEKNPEMSPKMSQELSSHQKQFVTKTLLAFAIVLLLSAGGAIYFAPSFLGFKPPVLAEPVDYARFNAMIQKSEHQGLEVYRWRDGQDSAQVPLERALEILREHPEGLNR